MAHPAETYEEESSEEDSVHTLSDQIVNKYEISTFDTGEKQYLPVVYVEELLTLENIVKELDDKNVLGPGDLDLQADQEKKAIVDYILSQPARTVFAIVVVVGSGQLRGQTLRSLIASLMRTGLVDAKLPATENYFRTHHWISSKNRPARPWKPATVNDFLQKQWIFLAPVFSPTKFQFDLRPNYILPMVVKPSSRKRRGNFATVFEVEVHSAHLRHESRNPDGTQATFAIKAFDNFPNDVDLQKDADDAWQNEVSALNQLRELNHPNLIRHIAAITRGDKHFLMFYWAQGGNLRDFWRRDKTPNVTPELVRDVLQQLRGMAEALQKLHEFRGEGHFRHGDIKPENILAFPSPAPSQTGIFKISDLGSAQYHAIATRLRERTPGKSFATMLYQAPEAVTKKQAALTRLYDIWSMGCVTLEFMVWLLYGYHELEAFTQSLRGKLNEPNCFFVDEDQPSATGPTRVAYVHPTVQACFDHLSKDPECTGDMALGQLLKVVQTKLLVINLPESTSSSPEGGNITVTDTDAAQAKTPPPPGGHRTDAAGFVRALDDILRHEDSANSHFWVTGKPRINTGLARNLPKSVTRSSSPHLSVPNWASPSGQRANRPRSLSPRVTSDIHVDGPGQGQVLSDEWSYPVDNGFAIRLLKDTGAPVVSMGNTYPSRLCDGCTAMDISARDFHIEEAWSTLESNARACDFCRLRWDCSKHLNRKDYPSVSFRRADSGLRINDDHTPALSIFQSPGPNITTTFQVGFPRLAGAKSKLHFSILRHWLKNCDDRHQAYGCQPGANQFVPTRLIDVGRDGSDSVRLYETHPGDLSLKYLALSHRWGEKGLYFRTFRNNLQAYKEGIDLAHLPSTFKDAVQVTRELGFQYLWIDSICIVQKDDVDGGDFEFEATRMEEVFSSASCVLAASSATGQSEGFLNQREGEVRDFVTFPPRQDHQPSLHVCPCLDDFKRHVLESPLSKRGWVMQERVLAHRTIYFTDKQTYWQCGDGVRCETLTLMENKLESFLADPNFPKKITGKMTSRGEKIVFYQDLYKKYSRLDFTHWEDRPIAVSGLERRLIRDLRAQGGFGIFDDGSSSSLLQRTLLWRRGADQTTALRKISFPPDREGSLAVRPPTWSWMAYQGGIDFLDMPFDGVDWRRDVHSPWLPGYYSASGTSSDYYYHTTDRNGSSTTTALTAIARSFSIKNGRDAGGGGGGDDDDDDSEVALIYDSPGSTADATTEDTALLKCVVIGRRRMSSDRDGDRDRHQYRHRLRNPEEDDDSARHYVLLVAPRKGSDTVYERVGVGFMPGRFIELDASAQTSIKIL